MLESNNRYYHYEVYASTDKENWTKVADKNTNGFKTQNGEKFDLDITARYLKIVGKYNSRVEVSKIMILFHLVEWKVSGKLYQRKQIYSIKQSYCSSRIIK